MSIMGGLAPKIRVEAVSADIPGFLAAAAEAGVVLGDLETVDDLTVRFMISSGDMKILSPSAERRGDMIRVLARRGLYWKIRALGKRPMLVVGMGLLLALTLFVPTRVLSVEVAGNGILSANRILEAAASCGVRFGASRRAVRSEGVKNALLDAMPELSWAGVNTYGARAVISVGLRQIPEPKEEPAVSSIIAQRDGILLTCRADRGTARFAPGQAVQAGDVLISGYTDCGLCITATRATGEVMALTTREMEAITPANCLKIGKTTGEEVTYSLILGNYRVNFDNNSGISPSGCGRMVTEYTLTLPGNFPLPVTLVKETITDRSLDRADVDADTAGTLLSHFAGVHLREQMIAGTVTEAVETLRAEDGRWVLSGNYACTEMIGRERAEQNGE